MSKRIHPWISDEDVLGDFKEHFSGITSKKSHYLGEMIQKAMKLILAVYGHEKYINDFEVKEIWEINRENTHAHDPEINMIKAVDNTPPSLVTKREKVYAVLLFLQNEYDETFTSKQFKSAAAKVVGVSDSRTLNSYIRILKDDKRIKDNMEANTYEFVEVNEFKDTYFGWSEIVRNDLFKRAKAEAAL